MLVIKTKYLGPTDHKGSRIKATSDHGSVTVPHRGDRDIRESRKRAVITLWEKLHGCDPGENPTIKTLVGSWLGDEVYWFVSELPPNEIESEA